jgi:hypothetical protein
MTPDQDQEAFIAQARARLRELEALREEAHISLTADDLEQVEREFLLRLDDIHGAITRALRGQPATLNAHPLTRYTIYRLDLRGDRWLRILTTHDLPAALRHLIEQQVSGEIAHVVAWVSLADRTSQERDDHRFRPRLAITDASDHSVRM